MDVERKVTVKEEVGVSWIGFQIFGFGWFVFEDGIDFVFWFFCILDWSFNGGVEEG